MVTVLRPESPTEYSVQMARGPFNIRIRRSRAGENPVLSVPTRTLASSCEFGYGLEVLSSCRRCCCCRESKAVNLRSARLA